MEPVLSLLGALLVVCAVCAGSYLFTRYVVGRAGGGIRRNGRHITVLEQVSLSREQKLLLVRVGRQVHLIGTAQGSVTLLQTIPPEEAESWEAEAGAGGEMGFQEALRNVLRQRKQ